MGEEKKITVTGVDSVTVQYEFTIGTYTAPGTFRHFPNFPNLDYTRSRKITKILVYDGEATLLDSRNVSEDQAWVSIATGASSIDIWDDVEDGDTRVYIEYARTGGRGSAQGLYHADLDIDEIEINAEAVEGWDGKGTIEVYVEEKMPVEQLGAGAAGARQAKSAGAKPWRPRPPRPKKARGKSSKQRSS